MIERTLKKNEVKFVYKHTSHVTKVAGIQVFYYP